jgi:hypothetical protein
MEQHEHNSRRHSNGSTVTQQPGNRNNRTATEQWITGGGRLTEQQTARQTKQNRPGNGSNRQPGQPDNQNSNYNQCNSRSKKKKLNNLHKEQTMEQPGMERQNAAIETGTKQHSQLKPGNTTETIMEQQRTATEEHSGTTEQPQQHQHNDTISKQDSSLSNTMQHNNQAWATIS